MLQLLLLFVAITLLYKWLNKKPDNFPPGPPTLPLFGSLPFIKSKNFHYWVEENKEKYGPLIGLKFGPLPAIAVCGSKEVLEVLKHEDFQNRPKVTIQFRNNAQGIMFANGDAWKDQRRFTLRHLRDLGFGKSKMVDVILEEIDEFFEKVMIDGSTLEIRGLFQASAVNLIWALVSGERLTHSDANFKQLLSNIEYIFRSGNVTGGVNAVPGLKKFLKLFHEFESDRIEQLTRVFFKKSIEKHRKSLDVENPRDFFDVYLCELQKSGLKPSFSEETMLEITRDLFFAGTESSANTISFCLIYLILHPEWQKRLQNEVDEVLNGRLPTFEDRVLLPQMEAFVTETFRCNTIAPFAVPKSTVKDVVFGGYNIPKDTFVLVSIWSVLQDKQIWGDPENFRPDRFLNERGEFVKTDKVPAFGLGPRICIGESVARMFIFLFMVRIIQTYNILPASNKKPLTTCLPGFTTAPQPFLINVESRKTQTKQKKTAVGRIRTYAPRGNLISSQTP